MEDVIDKEITVHIRSPSLNETLEVKTTLNATILTLKKSIEPVHPHHPKPTNQRIIYSGKLLKDADILTEILKTSDEEVTATFHLVVKPSLDAATTSSRTHTPISNPSFPHASTSSSSSPPNTFFSDRAPQNTSFQMPQFQQQQPMYPSSLPGGYQVVCINGQYYLAPTLVLSQNILPQQFHNTQVSVPNTQPPMYQQQTDANASASPQPQPQAQQYQQQPQPQEPVVQPYINQIPQQQQQQQNNPLFGGNAPMLAQPAIAQRATSIWLALKLIVVLFMLCQGASIERILIFHAIAFVFFLYQTGRLRFVLRRVRVEDLNRFRPGGGNAGGLQRPAGAAQGNVDGNAEGASTSVNNNSDNLTQRRQNHGEESASSQDNASGSSDTATQEPARPLTALDVWKRGAYTFFASLWPTYGVDPQIAQAFQNDNNNNNQE
ncbi:hypothetical protein PS15p_201336 [Mucor circinelloides]